MPNSNFQQSALSFVAEDNAGETPSSPSMQKLRTTDPLAITAEQETLESEEPYDHRQKVMQRHGQKSVGGSVPFELSYGAYNGWLEALLGGSWSDETAGTPNTLKIGNSINTFTVERLFKDIAQYEVFKGVFPNSMSLEITPALVSGSFDVIGMDYDGISGSSLGEPSDVATNEPFDGLAQASLQEGGSSIATVTSLNMEINNNANIGALVGSGGGDVPTLGQIAVTGTLTARFQDDSLLTKFYNETETSLQVVLGDTDTLTFDFPRIKYNGSGRESDNNTLDVSLPFEALYDSSESTGITVTDSNAA